MKHGMDIDSSLAQTFWHINHGERHEQFPVAKPWDETLGVAEHQWISMKLPSLESCRKMRSVRSKQRRFSNNWCSPEV